MTALRVLIVDDEPLARRRLQLHLRQMAEIDCIGSASGCHEGLAMASALEPDVILLDIKMRDGTGFDFLDALPSQCHPCVIFVTAFDRHAVRAFEANAADFLVKPVEFARLEESLIRSRQSIELRDRATLADELEEVVSNMRDQLAGEGQCPRYEAEIWVRHRVSGFIRIAVADIDWIAAEDDYVKLVVGEHSHLLRGTLKDMEARLDPDKFLRIHRSTIVRSDRIVEFRREGLHLSAILGSGDLLRVGRVQARTLRRRLAEMEKGLALGFRDENA